MSVLDLLDRTRTLMQEETNLLQETRLHLLQWRARAQRALEVEDETEARQLLTAAASWLRLSPESQPVVDAISDLHLMDRGALAAALLEGAADRMAAARELVGQECIKNRLGALLEECRFTVETVRGPRAKA